MKDKAVAIVSGGMDSITLAYLLAYMDYDLTMLSFDYGQKHAKEIHCAILAAQRLHARHHIIDLSSLAQLLHSALTSPGIDVPHGHYAADNMRLTVVPNRNAIMLSIAWGIAVSAGAVMVAAGMHAGDHPIYPDCRELFVTALEKAFRVGTEGFGQKGLTLYAPFMELAKHDIVSTGMAIDVPYVDTWSCYEGGNLHCGKCGTCVERREAFELAGVEDPTLYQGD